MYPSEDSPSSMWMVRAAELFPKFKMEKEDDELSVPYSERKYGEKLCNNCKNKNQQQHFLLIFAIFSF